MAMINGIVASVPYAEEDNGPFDYTSDDYWVVTEGDMEYGLIGARWSRPVGNSDHFFFQWTPIGGWETGFRPVSVNVTANSDEPESGSITSFDATISFLDSGFNTIGSEAFGFTLENQDRFLDIPLDFTGLGDIAYMNVDSFLYTRGPVIRLIEFVME